MRPLSTSGAVITLGCRHCSLCTPGLGDISGKSGSLAFQEGFVRERRIVEPDLANPPPG
jgi:hypothetical protein